MMFEKGEKVYSFMGEELLEFIFVGYVDEVRVNVEDEENSYCIYRKHCYKKRDNCILGMISAARDFLRSLHD